MALSQYDNIYISVDYCPDRLWPIPYWPLSEPLVYEEVIDLHKTPAQVVAQYLLDEDAVGYTDEDWPIFVSFMPSMPDNCVGIFDTTPVNEGRVHRESFRRYYGISFMVRSSDAVEGREKMNQLVEYLKSINRQGVHVEDYTYRIGKIIFASGVLHLGRERGVTTRRHLFSLNLLATVHSLEWQLQ